MGLFYKLIYVVRVVMACFVVLSSALYCAFIWCRYVPFLYPVLRIYGAIYKDVGRFVRYAGVWCGFMFIFRYTLFNWYPGPYLFELIAANDAAALRASGRK